MRKLPRAVILLGLVSFFTDLSSEMIYPLMPIFLSTVLGAGAIALGIIEGIAESTASIFKVISGFWADRSDRRKPLILGGYTVAGLVRPLIGLAASWPFVLAMRFVDRIGKGLRTSPRDALIADVTEPGQRGLAFGLHRSMDHAGAVVGPLVAAALLSFGSVSLRHVFFLSAIPAAVVVVVILAIREPKRQVAPAAERKTVNLREHWKDLGRNFKLLLVALLVFTLGNSTDAFLLLRMSDAGVPASRVAVLWSALHVVKMVATYTGGRLSDGVGSRTMIITGWIFYAFVYLAFALVNSSTLLIVIFLAYGIYFGLTEPSEKSWVADMVPSHLRGTAFGYYHAVIGMGALPASLLFGFLWHSYGAATAFITGAGLVVGASVMLMVLPLVPTIADSRPLATEKLPILESISRQSSRTRSFEKVE